MNDMASLIPQMYKLIYGNWATAVTYAFAELGLADCFDGSPRTAQYLAEKTDTVADPLERFLRCAGNLDLVKSTETSEQNTFELSSLGELLKSDHPKSQRAAARLNGAPYRYHPWGHLTGILKQGPSQLFSETMESGTLDFLAEKPELKAVFHQAMTDLSVRDDQAISQSYPFADFKHIIDIGCGHGSLIKAILENYPKSSGTMFDRQDTFEQLKSEPSYKPSNLELEGRLALTGGDFFETIPTNGDLYILKNTIHNWPEDEAKQLLLSVSKAMAAETTQSPNKRLLIIEYLVSADEASSEMANWLDLNFMILINGKSRSLNEYIELAESAGLVLDATYPTPIGRKILEFKLAEG